MTLNPTEDVMFMFLKVYLISHWGLDLTSLHKSWKALVIFWLWIWHLLPQSHWDWHLILSPASVVMEIQHTCVSHGNRDLSAEHQPNVLNFRRLIVHLACSSLHTLVTQGLASDAASLIWQNALPQLWHGYKGRAFTMEIITEDW